MLGDREATTAELAQDLPDVSTASLYRHISALTSAGYLQVVGERRIRGAVERTYRLPAERQSSAEFTLADREVAATLSEGEQRAAFAIFSAGLMAAYDGYLARDDRDVATDPVGYRTTPVYVDEDDVAELTEQLMTVMAAKLKREPGKRRVLLSTVLIPT